MHPSKTTPTQVYGDKGSLKRVIIITRRRSNEPNYTRAQGIVCTVVETVLVRQNETAMHTKPLRVRNYDFHDTANVIINNSIYKLTILE